MQICNSKRKKTSGGCIIGAASACAVKGKSTNRRTQIIITPKLDQFMELIGQAPKE